ncbi:MAG: DUF1385 domain-containing protein [Dehalococcoidales bacterium]|nr:DUF1385 domain-containing protein [Dehalococcoidales bacterium]
MAKQFNYGGQAVLEGVMIRGKKFIVTAIRKPNQEIAIDKRPLPSVYNGWMRSTPLLRGIIVLIESMVIGIQTLMYSGNVALEEEKEKISGGWIWLLMLVSLAFVVVIFFLAPLFLTTLLKIDKSSGWFPLVEGLIRIAFFVIYLRLVSLMPDIKRVFAYHGAEHKAVNAYEQGIPLEVEAIKKSSKAHVRCGGSFLVVVLIIAVIIFALIGKLVNQNIWLLVLSRIVLIPVIAALGYEFIYFAARHAHNVIVRILLTPGLWIQGFTTREPDDSQLEIAIAALKTAVEADNPPPETPAAAIPVVS